MSDTTTAMVGVRLLHRWVDLSLEALGAARQEIDALNVYPVPDADTGTNLYLTLEAAAAAMRDRTAAASQEHVEDALHALAHGALLGARGNSGVIMAQLLRVAGERLAAEAGSSPPTPAAPAVAAAMASAAEAAYQAVAEPVEGTILTVARAAAEAAGQAADSGGDLAATVRAAAEAARAALERTPEQLEALRRAGVVDAGGRGLCVLLDAAETAVTGRRSVTRQPELGARSIPTPAQTGAECHLAGGAYEVMYLLDADDGSVQKLRESLAPLGDSLVIVGGGGLWNVHVHVDDPGAAIEAGIAAGRPHRVRVTHLPELADHTASMAPAVGAEPRETPTRGVVAVTAGPGLAALFRQAGAVVVESVPGRRCTTGELVAAIRRTGATEVVVLPNDPDCLAVAEAAAHVAREESVRVAVLPTRAQVQGIAAIAVHEPGREFDDDVVHMTSAASHTRHGGVTIAARDAITTAGPCRRGDVLGAVEGDFAVVGNDLGTVACEVVDRLLTSGGEMVTMVTGSNGSADVVEQVQVHLRGRRPDVDAVVYDGGQQRYALLIAVE